MIRRLAKSLLVLSVLSAVVACSDDERTIVVGPPTEPPATGAPTGTATVPASPVSTETRTEVPSTSTPTPVLETPPPTEPVLISRDLDELPPGPVPEEVGCGPDDDFCDHGHTEVLGIAHAFTNPDEVVYYKVTVDPYPTDTD